MDLSLDTKASRWPKQVQCDQTCFARPSISARMRKRRAFADKELENVMLEKELRQRELRNEFPYPGPAVHPGPTPASPNLDCCVVNKDPPVSGYVSVYKYKPLYECDFQFYQFFHLKSCSSADCTDFYQSLEQSRQDDVQNICNITDKELITPTSQEKRHGNAISGPEAVKPTLMDSNGSSVNSASGSAWLMIGGQDISESSRMSELGSVKAWCTDSHMDQAGAGDGSGGSPHGGPVGSPAAKPLPFSVEALLKA